MNKNIIFIIFILFLSSNLMLYDLGGKSLWTDELYTAGMVQNDVFSIPQQIIKNGETHPPLYYMLLRLWISSTDHNDFTLRLFSVFFNIFSLLLFYLISKDLTDEKTGIVALSLMAFSPLLIMYSQMARYYTLVLFLTLLSSYILIQIIINNKKSILLWFIYIISSVLFLYTFYLSISVLIAQVFLVFIVKKNDKDMFYKFIISWILITLLFLPWVLISFHSTSTSILDGGLDTWKPNYLGITALILRMIYLPFSFSVGESILYYNIIGIFAFVLFSLIFCKGLFSLKSDKLGLDNRNIILYFLFITYFTEIFIQTLIKLYIVNIGRHALFTAAFFYCICIAAQL